MLVPLTHQESTMKQITRRQHTRTETEHLRLRLSGAREKTWIACMTCYIAGSVAVAAIVRMRLGSKEGDFVRLDTWTRPLPQSVETLHWDYHVHSAIGIVTHWRSN